jgi:hypothetical protein
MSNKANLLRADRRRQETTHPSVPNKANWPVGRMPGTADPPRPNKADLGAAGVRETKPNLGRMGYIEKMERHVRRQYRHEGPARNKANC